MFIGPSKSSKVAVIFYALCTYSLVLKPQTFHVQNDFVHNHLFHFVFSTIPFSFTIPLFSLGKTSPYGNNLVVPGMQRSGQAHGPVALNSIRGPLD